MGQLPGGASGRYARNRKSGSVATGKDSLRLSRYACPCSRPYMQKVHAKSPVGVFCTHSLCAEGPVVGLASQLAKHASYSSIQEPHVPFR